MEKSFKIFIPTVEDVKEFVEQANRFACEATIRVNRYAVDAKSILGVFSVDTSKPVELTIEAGKNGVDDTEEFYAAIEQFVYKVV